MTTQTDSYNNLINQTIRNATNTDDVTVVYFATDVNISLSYGVGRGHLLISVVTNRAFSFLVVIYVSGLVAKPYFLTSAPGIFLYSYLITLLSFCTNHAKKKKSV